MSGGCSSRTFKLISYIWIITPFRQSKLYFSMQQMKSESFNSDYLRLTNQERGAGAVFEVLLASFKFRKLERGSSKNTTGQLNDYKRTTPQLQIMTKKQSCNVWLSANVNAKIKCKSGRKIWISVRFCKKVTNWLKSLTLLQSLFTAMTVSFESLFDQ